MTMKLELPPNVQEGLLARANESGMSLEAFVEQVLRDLARHRDGGNASESEPFWKTFTRQIHALPDAVFEHLPEDGASEHDHYLFGSPKRNA